MKMEYGSDFSYSFGFKKKNKTTLHFDLLTGNGRQAILKILEINKIECLWLPAYYCYSITPYFNAFKINFYRSNPLDKYINLENIKFNNKDALLIIDYFGFGTKYALPETAKSIVVIEDKSHNPFSNDINEYTDYSIGSLRKTIPIPDGGFINMINKKHKIEIKTNMNHIENSYTRLSAMISKVIYLEKNFINEKEKINFRKKFIKTEENLNFLPISKISEFSENEILTMNIHQWYHAKYENLLVLIEKLSSLSNLNVINKLFSKNLNEHIVLILNFKNFEEREHFRKKLIQNNIFPAILWDIPAVNRSLTSDFDKLMLMIHCDGRYSKNEINK